MFPPISTPCGPTIFEKGLVMYNDNEKTATTLGNGPGTTLCGSLEARRVVLEKELAAIKRVKKLLIENPKLEELFALVSKVQAP